MPKQPDQIGGGLPGPGRPKGSVSKRSERLVRELESAGLDPQRIIRKCFDIVDDPDAKRGEVIYAAATVLPYMLPKLSAIEVSGGEGGQPVRIRVVMDPPKEEAKPEPGKP